METGPLERHFYKNACFINQVNGGDEWLVIRDDIAFESFTMRRFSQDGILEKYIERFLKASKEELESLNY